MKRLIAMWEDGHCNITITHIAHDLGDIVAYNGEEVVGVFKVGFVNALYVSEGKMA